MERAFIVTYLGEGVALLPRVGVFQTGTRAWVDAEAAEAARHLPHFVVTGPGISAPVVEQAPPRPPRRRSAVMAAVKPDEK